MEITKLKNQKTKILLLSSFFFLVSTFLIGCAQLKQYAQNKKRIKAISGGDLKGLSRIDIIKKFGEPLAVSQSGLSESWYYAQPREIWIWFNQQQKVERWEVK